MACFAYPVVTPLASGHVGPVAESVAAMIRKWQCWATLELIYFNGCDESFVIASPKGYIILF